MPVKSPAANPTKTRKTRTRKTSTKPVAKVTKVKPVQNSKIRSLITVQRPSTARLISPQKYLKDIQTRWEIHNYEITMLISDLTKGFNAVKPHYTQLVKLVSK